ncbi:hypothetical protein LTR66_000068 [Elasticomyces elasticus]|nr:hypothetical protein LTR66_000068 [Elasticomyces elasticus]
MARYRPAYHDQPTYRDRHDGHRTRRSRSPPFNDGMYHFRGAAETNYRPAYQERDRNRTNTDSHRPDNDRDHDRFTFRSNEHGRVRFPPAPPFNQYDPQGRRHARDSYRGSHRGHGHPHRGRGGFQPMRPSERPLINSHKETTPEQFLGVNEGHARFKDVNEMTDSEAEDMNLQSENDETEIHVNAKGRLESEEAGGVADEDQREAKRVRRASPASISDDKITPKWSNPDPYTVLPPTEKLQKKKDVVNLIRKAKITAMEVQASRNLVAENADFISFGFEDTQEDNDKEGHNGSRISSPGFGSRANASTGPATFDHPNSLPSGRFTGAPGTTAMAQSTAPLQPPPQAQPSLSAAPLPLGPPPSALAAPVDVWPPPTVEAALRNRRRSRESTSPVPLAPSNYRKRKRSAKYDGQVVEEWQSVVGSSSSPWCTLDHSMTESPGFWLHKEICDFYEYVKPQAFEDQIRRDLVSRVDNAVRNYYRGARVQAFGSFACGLYLPTADMDLVALSPEFMETGRRVLCPNKSWMYRFADQLARAGILDDGSEEIVYSAKVPIVKFIDKVTGLRVDVSFDNDTGIKANRTFKNWKTEFPAMPVIATLIKQFLNMRALNEVFTGGLGGFSVICLVTSMMQHLPSLQAGSMRSEQNYGDLLLNFLDLYGNKIDRLNVGIEMDPPGYFSKFRRNFGKTPRDRLTIMDPNRAGNDISGGSKNIDLIFRCFADACSALKQRMYDLQRMDFASRKDASVLHCMWGGDYSSFEAQRRRLRKLAQNAGYRVHYAEALHPEAIATDENTTRGRSPTREPGRVIAPLSKKRQAKDNEDDSERTNGPKEFVRAREQPYSMIQQQQTLPQRKHWAQEKPVETHRAKRPRHDAEEISRQEKTELKPHLAGPLTGANPSNLLVVAEPVETFSGQSGTPRAGRGPAKKTVLSAGNKADGKSNKKKTSAANKKLAIAEEGRSKSFKRDHPHIPDIPDRLTKTAFKVLKKKHNL